MTDLDKLIEAVEAGDDAAFRRFNRSVFSTPCQSLDFQLREENCRHAFKGSLDAAKALNDALLPNWTVVNIGQTGLQTPVWAVWIASTSYLEDFLSADGRADNLARAWLIAILKGYRTTQEASE